MLQTSDNIESSTMTYVFDMFGKSVTQMLQASIQQQTAIDELRQQIRSCQTQITNICGTLEDFEDRMGVKMQEMRPTLYTRDGVPLDDALEMLQNKIQTAAEKSVSQGESISRLEAEMKGKLDIEEFEATSQAANEANDSFTEMSLTVQTLQKELQKQRADQDSMMEKCAQLVQIQIQRLKTQAVLNGTPGGFDNSDEFVTKDKFKEVIQKLRIEFLSKKEESESDYFDENDLEGTLAKIKMHSAQIDADYQKKKAKVNENLNKILTMLGEKFEEEEEEMIEIIENPSSEEVEIEQEYEVKQEETNEFEVRDVGTEVKEEKEGEVEVGEVRKQERSEVSTRRSIGINYDAEQEAKEENEKEAGEEAGEGEEGNKKKIRKKKKKATSSNKTLLEEAIKERDSQKVPFDASQINIDEKKLSQSIVMQVMNKVDPLLVEMLSSTGSSGLKLDKGDAKELISQLSALNQLKEEMAKVKMLISIKYDRADAENELSIRITRDEFFSMLLNLFPSNSMVQKAYSTYKKKLPPLKAPSTAQTQIQLPSTGQTQIQLPSTAQSQIRQPKSKSRGDDLDDKHNFHIHQRQVKTAAPSSLVPARNSKLLALNQKFLKGADGKYYLRDINTSDSSKAQNNNSIVGSVSKSSSVSPDQAFDFQPFLPISTVKEQVGRISVPSQHRARTPPDPND